MEFVDPIRVLLEGDEPERIDVLNRFGQIELGRDDWVRSTEYFQTALDPEIPISGAERVAAIDAASIVPLIEVRSAIEQWSNTGSLLERSGAARSLARLGFGGAAQVIVDLLDEDLAPSQRAELAEHLLIVDVMSIRLEITRLFEAESQPDVRVLLAGSLAQAGFPVPADRVDVIPSALSDRVHFAKLVDGSDAVMVEPIVEALPELDLGHVTRAEPPEETALRDGPDVETVQPEPTTVVPAEQRDRYLEGRGPDRVLVGAHVQFVVRVGIDPPQQAGAVRFDLDVPAEGIELSVFVYAPGFATASDARLRIVVPRDKASDWVPVELTALQAGQQNVVLTLFHPVGRQLAEMSIPVYVGQDIAAAETRATSVGVGSLTAAEGEVSLLIDWLDDLQKYRFQIVDRSTPAEVLTRRFDQTPRSIVSALVDELNAVAKAEHKPSDLHAWLKERGVALWANMLPEDLKDQYFAIRDRITTLRIVSRDDPIPWELLYPLAKGHDDGFLIEQFPVFRGVRGISPTRLVGAGGLVTVVPQTGAPAAALNEKAKVQAHWPANASVAHVSDLAQLRTVLQRGEFGVIHFACHNTHDPNDAAGATIKFGSDLFTPTDLATIGELKTLEEARPLVFLNACHTAGQAPSYTEFAGWASSFMKAGAGAFVGSMWKVRDEPALAFADTFYSQLRGGATLSTATKQARAALDATTDPTWLAYTVYGDVNATLAAV